MLSHLLLAIGLSASIGLGASVNIERALYPNSIGQIETDEGVENGGWFGDFYDNSVHYYYDGYTFTATTLFWDDANSGTTNPIDNYPYGSNLDGNGFKSYRCFFFVLDTQYNNPDYVVRMPYVDVTTDRYVEYEWYDHQEYFLMILKETDAGDIQNIEIQCSNYFANNFNINLFITVNNLKTRLKDIQDFMSTGTPYSKIYTDSINFLDNSGVQSFTLSLSNRGTSNPAYNDGLTTGYNNGYTNGYNNGVLDGSNAGVTFFNLFGAIADTPLLMLRSLFNFDLFGANLLVVVLSLVTGLMVFYVVRKFI